MPVAAPMATCTKDCVGIPSYASDADCDGGGPGAELGTDCCRLRPAAPRASRLLETCNWASDADSDDGGGPGSEFQQADCPYGSDCTDCGPRMPTLTRRAPMTHRLPRRLLP